MPPRRLESDLSVAIRAAHAAGELALRHFHAKSEWWDKSPGNPVGVADLECDSYLKDRLLGARPEDGWLSEETADTADRLSRHRLWVVDPIDGTRDFIRGRTGWAVSVALVENGEVTIAALFAPARQQLFAAIKGRGAQCNGKRLHVSDLTTIEGIRLPIDAVNLTASFWPEPWPGTATEKPNSLALRMAKVASNEADAWMEGRTIAEWDVAASALILTEAGGTVTDRTGQPLTFNKPDPVFHGIAAATPALHAVVRDRLDYALKSLAAVRRGTTPTA
ncbi:3'(2'),5'-bisphosphate nucleotidase CysQ [Polymorphobacter glacialis]|uniref:3'(2'),5'-bisphosphate nucleotidase CysQ n=1 Tax=Sandarakinorhabdus glacialis TaxID=1614636 RepID=A0A917E9A4_9SPHN|nr:3'(2'),5'-bisphosphate nucleotidase CysQ [Polymorphobacter glacialis]GGE16451.1 3'(2'),5'-bisphosphate nucleotidase CysQ [Polymorphobacter glacialis]